MWIILSKTVIRLITDDFTLIIQHGGQTMFMYNVASISHNGLRIFVTDTRLRVMFYWYSLTMHANNIEIPYGIYCDLRRVINKSEINDYFPIPLASQIEIMNLLYKLLY
jgi:hypothetical protein